MANKNKIKQGLVGALALGISILPSGVLAQEKQEGYSYKNRDSAVEYPKHYDEINRIMGNYNKCKKYLDKLIFGEVIKNER